MPKRHGWLLLGVALSLGSPLAQGAPNLLYNGTHAAGSACLAQLLPGSVDSTIFVDQYVGGGPPSNETTDLPTLFSVALSGSASIQRVANGATVDHHPYVLVSSSYTNDEWVDTPSTYTTALADNLLNVWAYILPNSGTVIGPPILGANTLYTAVGVPCSGGSVTSPGAEFCLTGSWTGIPSGGNCASTDTASGSTSVLANILIALKQQHPTFNWFDIKAALRQTSGNWATGYKSANFGYGGLDYTSANAIASTASLYLQPPALLISNYGHYASLTLLPYRQTRRSAEVVYSVSPSYVWPVKNEYTTADITASGATLLYTSNGTDTTPTFTYAPAASGMITFVAFTTDGSGGYSRKEEFSPMAASFVIGVACFK